MIALRDITNSVGQPPARPGNPDKENEPVSYQKQSETECEDTIQVKAFRALEKMKLLSEEAVNHITKAKVMYKPKGISNIRSSGCKPKSWN